MKRKIDWEQIGNWFAEEGQLKIFLAVAVVVGVVLAWKFARLIFDLFAMLWHSIFH